MPRSTRTKNIQRQKNLITETKVSEGYKNLLQHLKKKKTFNLEILTKLPTHLHIPIYNIDNLCTF